MLLRSKICRVSDPARLCPLLQLKTESQREAAAFKMGISSQAMQVDARVLPNPLLLYGRSNKLDPEVGSLLPFVCDIGRCCHGFCTPSGSFFPLDQMPMSQAN